MDEFRAESLGARSESDKFSLMPNGFCHKFPAPASDESSLASVASVMLWWSQLRVTRKDYDSTRQRRLNVHVSCSQSGHAMQL
jgi:hypothetical protein